MAHLKKHQAKNILIVHFLSSFLSQGKQRPLFTPAQTNNTVEEWAIIKAKVLGGSPGLVVMGGGSHSEGRGLETRHHILDGHFPHLFVVKIVVTFV